MHANAISQPHALVVLWAQVPLETANGCSSILSRSVQSVRLSAIRCSAGWGELCFSSGTVHLWLICTPPVSEMVWRDVEFAAIWAME
jgi:hypothetical protein